VVVRISPTGILTDPGMCWRVNSISLNAFTRSIFSFASSLLFKSAVRNIGGLDARHKNQDQNKDH